MSATSDTLQLLKDAISAHVHIFLQLSWFSRLWVIQECMLAKQLHMYCGPRKIDWLDFATAIETLIVAVYTVRQYAQELGILLPAWKLVTYRARYYLLNSGRFYSTESKAELSLLLDEMRDKLCKDDQDRVYAILAAGEDSPRIRADYTKTVAEVYTEYVSEYLGHTTLFNAGLCRRGPFPADLKPIQDSNYLPSWVPDLRNTATEQWSPIFGNSFATSNDAVGRLGWSKAPGFPGVLISHALKFDLVECIRSIRGNDLNPTTEPKFFLAMVNHIENVRGQFAAAISRRWAGGCSLSDRFGRRDSALVGRRESFGEYPAKASDAC
jgi:hypothetical protein